MTNKYDASNIISTVDFNKLAVGNLTSLKDQNSTTNYTWTPYPTTIPVVLDTTTNTNYLNFSTTSDKLYLSFTESIKTNNFFVEMDVQFSTKVNNTLFCFSGSNLNFYITLSNKATGFSIRRNTTISITFPYLFEPNTRYVIGVSKNYNTFTLYVNGKIIATKTDVTFNNTLTMGTQYYVVGSTYAISDDTYAFSGRIYSFNISFGPYIKYSTQYTTYGDQLVGRVNYNNLGSNSNVVLLGNITTTATISNNKVTVTSFNYNLKGKFTVFTGVTPRNASNESTLFNWSDTYKLNLKIIKFNNDPEVIVNEYTTSALDFENGIIDKVGTTVWNKEGTADITSVNKIFGNNSFETKALGDSLYTNSKIITGGSTPFTIEFDVLLRNINNTIPLFTSCKSVNDGFQMLGVVNNLLKYDRGVGVGTLINQTGKIKLRYNEINKISMIFDGVCIRFFVNGLYDFSIGSLVGYNIDINVPYRFLDYLVPFNNYRLYASGIIDNINIHDGIATKVRDHDPYEDYLVVDLAFDGENNSTKIVDNARLNERNEVKYNDNVLSLLHFEGIDDSNIIIDETGRIWNILGSSKIKTDQKIIGSSSCYFNGNSSVSSSNSSDFAYGTGNFTWEFFTRLNIINENQYFIDHRQSSGNDGTISYYQNKLRYYNPTIGVNSPLYDTNISLDINKWYHIAIVRNNNITSIYVDGIIRATGTDAHNFGNSECWLGRYSGSGYPDTYLNGYIDEFRIIKGKAVYTENFIPPTDPFNYVKKNNWTVNGNAKISTDQKFDGFSSLYLNVGSTIKLNEKLYLEQNDFTISFDLIMSTTDFSVSEYLFTVDTTDNSKQYYFGIYRRDSALTIAQKRFTFIRNDWYGLDASQIKKSITPNSLFGNSIVNNTTLPYRISIIRKNNTLMLYINGVLEDSTLATDSFNFENILIGGGNDNCYIKNFKIYKGVAVIPESPIGKIQLDFDDNLVDKYGNSTWTNNGVTFDQVNSVSGYAVSIDNNKFISTNTQNLNLSNLNSVIEFDVKPTNNITSYSNVMRRTDNTTEFMIRNNETGVYNSNIFLGILGAQTFNINNYYNWKMIRVDNGNLALIKFNDILVDVKNNGFVTFDISDFQIGQSSNSIAGYVDNFKVYKEDILSNDKIYKTTNAMVNLENNAIKATHSASSGYSSYTLVLDDAPILNNFTAELEILITGKSYGCLTFGTTVDYSLNDMDKFGYSVYVAHEFIRFGRGSNNSTAAWVQLATYTTQTDIRDSKYHNVKLVKNNSNFKIYLDNVFLFEVNDTVFSDVLSKFSINSYIAVDTISHIKSVKISDENEEKVYYKDWKSKISNVIDKPAVHLPLETNAINTGFTPLTINSVGNPTYTTIDGKKCIKFESGKYLTIDSNNIFNLGTSSDFYIEFDFYQSSSSSAQTLFATYESTGYFDLYVFASKLYINNDLGGNAIIFNDIITNSWYNFKMSRKGDVVTFQLNDLIFTHSKNLSINNLTKPFEIGHTGSQYVFNGYMSNFKMFVGTSEIPESYHDKKVLDLDFKPTGKSYLFKDNNNKCIIHPVNITQRDYQDSQYCCTFNGVDQYLQLGKNDLLNFGLDDFVIEIKFKINEKPLQNILLLNNSTANTNNRAYIAINGLDNSSPFKLEFGITNASSQVVYYQVRSNDDIQPNVIYNFKIISSNGNISMILNDEIQTMTLDNINNVNFNYGDNTYIGKVFGTDLSFKGSIYSIKVLRNTTDLTLLDTDTSNLPTSVTYELTNGTDITTIDYTEVVQKDIVLTKSDTTVSAKIGTDLLEVPTIDETLLSGNISMFTNYTGTVNPEIDIYNDVIESDSFNGITLVETDISDIVVEVTNDNEYLVEYIGDYTINGFIEGKENNEWRLINIENNVTYATGIGDYYFYGINPAYINSFKIIDETDNKEYRLTSTNYTRGQLIISLNANVCNDSNFCLKLFRRSMNEHIFIGTYEIINNICTINNLFVEERYDVMLFDRNTNIESRMMSDRTPIAY